MASSLRELFTPLIAYTLLFTRTPEEQQRSFGEVRAAFEKLLEQHHDAVKRLEIAPQDYDAGCFAVVAWADEMVLHHAFDPNRALYDDWRRSPLQVSLFGTANAGEEFFERIARLTPAQREVYEIYYLALCLGFRGRYYDEAREGDLADFRRQCAAHLPAPSIDLIEFEQRREHVTPQPYEVKAPLHEIKAKALSPYWWAVPIAAAAAVVLFLLWPGPDLQELENVVHSFDCAQIVIAGVQHGVVNLTGHIDSEEQRDLLRRKLEAVRGVKRVEEDDVSILPHPFCEVVEVLGPFVKPQANSPLDMRPPKGCNTMFESGDKLNNGERLTIELTSSKPLNHVYIDYYVADRQNVAHIFPNRFQQDGDVKNAEALTVGGSNDKSQWEINPPFGGEMLTVISSPKELFAPPRLEPETADEYLAALRQVLHSQASDPGLFAAYCFTSSAP